LREKKGNAKSREAVGGKDGAEEERGAGETRREGKEVSQTGPLTQDACRAYKVHDNATTLRKERERAGLCPIFVHKTRWTVAFEVSPWSTLPPFQFEGITYDSRNCSSLQFGQRIREREQVAPSFPIGKSKTRLSEKSRVSPERQSSY